MNVSEIINLYEEHECRPTFTTNMSIRGGILKVPSNIFNKFDAKEFIYEYDDKLNIYHDGIKVYTIDINEYAYRPFISVDIMCRCLLSHYSPNLVKLIDNDTEIGKNETAVLVKMRQVLSQPKNKRYENMLFDSLIEYTNGNFKHVVPNEVIEIFKTISEHYLEILNA